MKTMRPNYFLGTCFTAVLLAVCLPSLAGAQSSREQHANRRQSDREQLAADYRARRQTGDTASSHGYQPCRDGARCGYWGYGGYGNGLGYNGLYGGYYGNPASPGWSRSSWRGSDIPTTGYNRYRGR